MRIWDINPGYLNRQSLLGEHRELHGMFSIFKNNKKGYSKHPETLRWVDCENGLFVRHQQLSSEMFLRGYNEKTPLEEMGKSLKWPEIYIDKPFNQFEILKEKYKDKEDGRIPFPRNLNELWAQHKYSVLARNHSFYREIGPKVADKSTHFSDLVLILTEILRVEPDSGGIRNALQHMWGYVSDLDNGENFNFSGSSLKDLLVEIQNRAKNSNIQYLMESTALSELMVWL